MTGLEIFRDSGTTAGEIADIVSNPCPPVVPEVCDKFSCRECWQAWLETGRPPKEKGPSAEQTTPHEEGLHPNLAEQIRQQKKVWCMTCETIDAITPPSLLASAPPPPGRQDVQP